MLQNGDTAYSLARKNGHNDVCKLLPSEQSCSVMQFRNILTFCACGIFLCNYDCIAMSRCVHVNCVTLCTTCCQTLFCEPICIVIMFLSL